MSDYLPFIVIGLATGAVYGLAGVGLVLTYKTSGIFNFGYGAVAASVAFFFYWLHVDHGMWWPLAAIISVFGFAVVVGLLLELIARGLADASEAAKVVATVGLILIVASVGAFWHPGTPPTFPSFLPQETVSILNVNVTWEQIILFGLSSALAIGLSWFFRATRGGVVMRAVVDNQELVLLSGEDPVAVRRRSWIIGTVFAGVAGLLLAPTQQLDAVTLTTLVFAAFGAAAIGYFSNLPLTFVGGLIIGVASALVDKETATFTWLTGLPPALPAIVLFLVLILLPPRMLRKQRLTRLVPVQRPYEAPVRLRLVAVTIAVGLLALVPIIQSSRVVVWSSALIIMMLFLSLGLLIRLSGQISLCHMAFAAVGGAAFGHLSTDWGLPWLVALLLAAAIAVPVGAIVAIPAIRMSGVYLALATFGFGILMQLFVYARGFMFTHSELGVAAHRPQFRIGSWDLSSNNGFYYLVLLIAVLVAIAVAFIIRSRLGRLLEALADSPLALETNGAAANVSKVIIFCISSVIAALAGAMYSQLFHYGTANYFPAFTSLTLVAIVMLVPIGFPWYALVAAVSYSVIPGYISGENTVNALNLLYGVSAVLIVYVLRAAGAPEPVRRLLDRIGGRRPRPVPTVPSAAEPTTPPRADDAVSERSLKQASRAVGSGLKVTGLSVSFGGISAVRGLCMEVPAGKITGLIGPNGAGKTTTFNALSALNRPSGGRIVLHDVDVTDEGPAKRARRGLGRTFQRTELFDRLSVRQNVAMGREASMAGINPFAHLVGSRASSRLIEEVVDEALAITGLTEIAEAQAGLLTIGQRRMVELARALAGPFDMLLLDEPSSGLDNHETERFGMVLKAVVKQRGCGILLVEHDIALVSELCDYVYVLDFGELIFQGTPAEMHASEIVREAYLGSSSLEATVAAQAIGTLDPLGK